MCFQLLLSLGQALGSSSLSVWDVECIWRWPMAVGWVSLGASLVLQVNHGQPCWMGSVVPWQLNPHFPGYWEWQGWFPALNFSKNGNIHHSSWKRPMALRHPSWSSTGCQKGDDTISSDTFPQYQYQGEKFQVQTYWALFPFFSPPLFLSTFCSLRSLDSLITVVIIITHFSFCRALLRA